MNQPLEDHDLGFQHDLPRLIGRRRALALLGGAGLAAVGALPAEADVCFPLRWATAGPFPADGSNGHRGRTLNVLAQSGVVREDIRASFGPLTPIAEGVELKLELTLLDADGCAPLEDHAIYLWHCDANGRYSLYDRAEANYLRGVGVTDSDGEVSVTTIVPGCYPGRWPHIHFQVFENIDAAVAGPRSLLTGQIALPEMALAEVYRGSAPYAGALGTLRRLSIPRDTVFRDSTPQQLAQQTMSMSGDPEDGYTGSVTIPVDLKAGPDSAMTPPPGRIGGPLPPPTPLKR